MQCPSQTWLRFPPCSTHPSPCPAQDILDKAAFAEPVANQNGDLGRKSLRGSRFQNLDLSLARAFPLTRLYETARLILRADFHNVLNHANYNNHQPFLTAPDLGVALKGRLPVPSWSRSAQWPLGKRIAATAYLAVYRAISSAVGKR
jgi:hypothetical protein